MGKLTVEEFKRALSMCDCASVVGIEVDPLDTDVGVVASCLQAVLDVEPDKRPRAVVLMFDGGSVKHPLFKSEAVRAWATRFVESRGLFDTVRGLADDRILRAMAARFGIPPLLVASNIGCGRAKLLALAGYHDGLEVDGDGTHTWSLDKAGAVILDTWGKIDDDETNGREPESGAFS